MTRCTFINAVTRKDNDANVFSCTNYNTYITIESCSFINCGNSANQFIIRLPLDKSAIKIMRSKFEFTDLSKSCKVTNIMNNAHYLVINGSSFIGCAPDTFEFSICSDSNFVPTEPFQFNDNIVKNVKGQFMNGNNLRNKPIIIGNTFQDVELNGKFLISLSHNSPDIEISKTTFSNIKTGGNDYGGGIALLLPTTLTDSPHITVAFTKCQFINNEVYQASSSVTDGHYNGDGGAIHYGYELSIVETDIKFIDCTFNQNKAYRHGGAISLQTAGSVLILNCIFEENVANNKGVLSGELLYENHYNKKNSGVGGAIYINPTFNVNGKDYHMTNITIDGCSFIKNKAFNGYAIYIEGENLDIPFVISENDFINNYNENDSPTKGGVIASELMVLNKEDIEKLNEFINNELGIEAEKVVFVNQNGWPIDEDTPEPETPIATPEETPTQSPLGYEELLQKEATDDYAQNAIYANQHQIPSDRFTYEHSGAKNNRPITNAFDNNKDTYWVTSLNNSDTFKNYLTVTFANTQHIEAILFDSAYSTRKNDNPITRRYDGYPQIFKIYASMNDEELKLHSIFSGAPKETDIWDRTKLEFSTPIICDRIKVEFDEVTLDESFGNDYSVAVGNILFISPFSFVQTPEPTPIATPAATSTPTPTPLPTATMTPTPAETTPTEIIIDHDNLNNDLRYNKTVENFDAITVNIKVTNFTGINYTDNVGAIYVANAGFKCSTTKFVDCSSTEAGGGIHLSYSYDYENSYKLDSLVFIHCTAQYGGAVYLYSSSRRNSVQISGCLFMNNIALRTQSKDNKFGGSAIFMTAKTGDINSNTMVDNSGDSAIKIYNHFSRSSSSINKLMDLEQDKVIISECKFESSKKSLGFVYYFLGNGASKFELRNCYFSGELKEGAHYIDGKALSKNGPKLTIKKCRFAIDSRRAHNLDPSFISVDLNDQYFNYSDDDNKPFNWWKIIVTVAVPAVVIAIIIFVIVFVNKHKNNNVIEEYQMADNFSLFLEMTTNLIFHQFNFLLGK